MPFLMVMIINKERKYEKTSANILDGKFEHLVDEDNLQITHLQIKKAKKLGKVVRKFGNLLEKSW
ncbi:hypothetical protein [Arcanobacterium urinimassiliense]|uniref:hypothetical protein n=1 Tax=Arcanobacterium urinimassiliense TaxID=1871014 RepID=UPI0009397747|nr:hypothetical protein [Arcanobacterium urinimassiliense]